MQAKLLSTRLWRVAGFLTVAFFVLSLLYTLLTLIQALSNGVSV